VEQLLLQRKIKNMDSQLLTGFAMKNAFNYGAKRLIIPIRIPSEKHDQNRWQKNISPMISFIMDIIKVKKITSNIVE
jgi:hypothetical protein